MSKTTNRSKQAPVSWLRWFDRTSMYGFELFMAAFGLTVAAVAVDYGIFAVFNHLESTGGNASRQVVGEMSLWMVAAMLVWLPLSLGFYMRARGEMATRKERADSRLHKVVVSIYLFINILILAGLLFTVLYSLIRIAVGDSDMDADEMLMRVTAPALITTGLHAWMLFAFSRARFATRKLFASSFAVLTVLVMVILLAVSFGAVRGAADDDKRSHDLRQISAAVKDYYREEQKLPDSLTDATINEDDLKLALDEYTYDRQLGGRYELCADFATDTLVGSSYYVEPDEYSSYESFSIHGSGKHCFKLLASSRYDLMNDSIR